MIRKVTEEREKRERCSAEKATCLHSERHGTGFIHLSSTYIRSMPFHTHVCTFNRTPAPPPPLVQALVELRVLQHLADCDPGDEHNVIHIQVRAGGRQ
jgi:hypothetical protein